MSIDNISEFPQPASQASAITLDSVIQTITDWRARKDTRNEPIPDVIWKQIFILLKKFPEPTLSAALVISRIQFQRKLDEQKLLETLSSKTFDTPHVDFCEARQVPTPLHKPARIPATNTLVVEFCRSDGRIMKIHTTTDSFAELMKAFFSGG